MGETCSTHYEDEKIHTIFYLENLNGKFRLLGLGVCWKVILKLVLKK
jgi:hypothetical protein